MPIYSYISICFHFECFFFPWLSWITTTSLPWLCLGKVWWAKQPQFVLFRGLFIYLVSFLASFLALHIAPLSFMLYPYPIPVWGFPLLFQLQPLSIVSCLSSAYIMDSTSSFGLISCSSIFSDFLDESPGSHACSGSTDASFTTTPDVHWKQLHSVERIQQGHITPAIWYSYRWKHLCHWIPAHLLQGWNHKNSSSFWRKRKFWEVRSWAQVWFSRPGKAPFQQMVTLPAQPGGAPWLVSDVLLTPLCKRCCHMVTKQTEHEWLHTYPCSEVHSSTPIQQQRGYIDIPIVSSYVEGSEPTLQKNKTKHNQ